VRIPKLGVDAPVGSSYVGDAQMDTPEGPATVFWYDLAAWDGLGGLPGEGKNAIFSGHVDYAAFVPYAGVSYRGKAVFAGLGTLAPGDSIFVEYNGQSLEYKVQWVEQVNAGAGGRWAEIWSSDVAVDSITLYTCGGEFDFTERSYIDRVVVRAERA
jgi:sortase (surface protein transpeptidase)